MIADRNHLAPLIAAALLMGAAVAEPLGVAAEEARPALAAADPAAVAPPSGERLHGLLGVLESDDYSTRMGAQAELLDLGTRHAATVGEALVGPYLTATDPDLRARLRLILWNAKRSEAIKRPVGFVGIQMQDSFRQLVRQGQANPGFQRTVQIVSVIEGTAAARSDLRLGDQILAIDGKGFDEGDSPSFLFKEQISARAVGDQVELKIARGAEELMVKVQLGERPTQLMGLADDERVRLDAAFNAFVREAATKRGLPVPGSAVPDTLQEEGTDPDEDPFAP